MMQSPLPGPIGERIKKRLESAAIRFKQLITWEELRRYILQDPKWEWDEDIVLDWQRDITDYFLESCKACHTDDTIKCFKSALEEGQQVRGLDDTNVNEAGDLEDEEDDDDDDCDTSVQPKYNQKAEPERIIFVVRWANKNYDGLRVKYTDRPMSKISDRIVLERWELKDEMYSTLIGDGATGNMTRVVDLTWELRIAGSPTKSYTTTFAVVPDNTMSSDAEFGRNRFDPLCSRQMKGHSVTKSLSKVEMSVEAKASKSRSLAGKSSSSSSHRRQTVPSTSGHLGYNPSKDEYIREQIVAGLRIDAEKQWERREQSCLESDVEDDDESFNSGKWKQQSSPDTSVGTKESARHKPGKR